MLGPAPSWSLQAAVDWLLWLVLAIRHPCSSWLRQAEVLANLDFFITRPRPFTFLEYLATFYLNQSIVAFVPSTRLQPWRSKSELRLLARPSTMTLGSRHRKDPIMDWLCFGR